MRRKNRADLFAEAALRGNFDEMPILELGIDPQLHLSRNDVAQPFFLICEHDCVIVQMSGAARIEFRNASVNYFDLVLGDFVYVPGGTPHRLVPRSASVHLRYKADDPGLEAVAWFSPTTGREISRVVWDCATELPQEAYLRACTLFNATPSMRTCEASGEALPPIDLTPFNWQAVAQDIRTSEKAERERAAKRGLSFEPKPRADRSFRAPPTHTEPLRVNVYDFVRAATTQLNPMFPYLGPGCIVPCSAMHDPAFRGGMGYFLHENTQQEVNVCFGARSSFRAPGQVFVGPLHHGVGEKPSPDAADDTLDKHGVGERPGNGDRADMIAIAVITQRQAIGTPQREAFSVVCEKCDTQLHRYPYDAHAFPDAIEDVGDQAILGLPTISQDAFVVEEINRDESLRTCKACGHVNPKFPTQYWGWADYRRRTHVVVQARKTMADAAEKMGVSQS